MNLIDVANLKDELTTLIDRLEAGEAVAITRDGQPFACVTPTPPVVPRRKPIDVDTLETLARSLPYQDQGAGDLVRMMRDGDRY